MPASVIVTEAGFLLYDRHEQQFSAALHRIPDLLRRGVGVSRLDGSDFKMHLGDRHALTGRIVRIRQLSGHYAGVSQFHGLFFADKFHNHPSVLNFHFITEHLPAFNAGKIRKQSSPSEQLPAASLDISGILA